ncbi:MAG: SAM-dependent methyltransferase [Gammaproteobacteria bacterium]|nr:MAG: SAM-dependent methyltransferase [Gammaproteobacteria bacterium]RTZ60773.1 MAG: SAM-dependent methyltransferase [Gammaproteobacteria bacterium]
MQLAEKYRSVTQRLYPEYDAGGFTREDNSVIFYTRVQGLLEKHMTVLDFGAGTNIWANSPDRIRTRLMRLQGACETVIGVDPDPGVLNNPWLDQAICVQPGEPLPFEDETFDMIVSFAVFEHIDDPGFVSSELDRVLKPGGWLCAWTPNKWGYVGIGARLIPNRFHAKLLATTFNSKQDTRQDSDVYPVRYQLNTMNRIKKLFPSPKYRHYSYYYNGPPSYHGERMILALMYKWFEMLTPAFFDRYLHIIIRKTGAPATGIADRETGVHLE